MISNSFKRDVTIAEIGEKALIRDFIKPYFNRLGDPYGVGDDCAIVDTNGDLLLCSTDRVPVDLISFRAGILDHKGLGDYLARLNLSDIAASGGTAKGLLLNLGLPYSMRYGELEDFCIGFREAGKKYKCDVLGGDITAASELSASATALGTVKKNKILSRVNARPGDSVFVSRPIGLTPAAFEFLNHNSGTIPIEFKEELERQFTDVEPMFDLALGLQKFGHCTSCMDNTDGIGQSLTELGESSSVAIVVAKDKLQFPKTVTHVASRLGVATHELAFSAGADFSLVGTVAEGSWSRSEMPNQVQVIGKVEEGSGVWIEDNDQQRFPLKFQGWNYFLPQQE